MRTRQILFAALLIGLLASCSQNTPSPATPAAIEVSPTSTATVIPTNTPDPIIKARQDATLYSQDFENGSADGLYDFNIGKWNVLTEDDGNHVYCNEPFPDGLVVNFGADQWTDYALEMRVKGVDILMNSNFSLYTRFERHKYLMYYGGLNLGYKNVDLAYNEPYVSYMHQNYPFEENTWYLLRMDAAGGQIEFFIDDQLIGSGTGSQRSQGKAGFSLSPKLKVCVDDIHVWALDQNGQIAQLPARPEPLGLEERLAAHKFPKLFYQNQDNDPTKEALDPIFYWDIVTFSKEVAKSGWVFLGPSGIIRSNNPNAVILVTHSIQEYYPEDSSVTGQDFVSGLKPEWVMRDIYGEPFPAFDYGDGYWSKMINLSTGASQYIPEYVNEKLMNDDLFDGIFYDGTNEFWWQADPGNQTPGGPIDFDNDGKADTTAALIAAQDAGLQKLLKETRRVLPPNSLITGNGGWDGSLVLDQNAKSDTILADLLNGRMIEGFLHWEKYNIGWLKSMRAYYLMQQVSVEPRIPLIMAYCTGSDDDHLRYTLASALLFDGYFTCTDVQDGSLSHPYTSNWWYDEYSVDLSTGEAVQSLDAKGYLGWPVMDAYNVNDPDILLSPLLVENDRKVEQITWRRDFQNGIVLVNPSSASKTIDLKGSYRKILGVHDPQFNDGSVVTKITLLPKSGIILLNP